MTERRQRRIIEIPGEVHSGFFCLARDEPDREGDLDARLVITPPITPGRLFLENATVKVQHYCTTSGSTALRLMSEGSPPLSPEQKISRLLDTARLLVDIAIRIAVDDGRSWLREG